MDQIKKEEDEGGGITSRPKIRPGTLRHGRRGRLESDEEVEFDASRSLADNVRDSLKHLSQKSGVTKGRKLGYLNALAKQIANRAKDDDLGLRLNEILLCLRIPLTHESPEVRAGTLRVLRKLASSEEDVLWINRLNMHHLIVRCIEIDLDNKVERLQALRLARQLLVLGPAHFPQSIARGLVGVAEGEAKENDRLQRVCLAAICELSVLNSDLFLASDGVQALTHSLLDCSMPRMAEAIIGSLLRLHNNPRTRSQAGINLGIVVAPFTEFRYIHSGHLSSSHTDHIEEKEFRFSCSEQAILSMLRAGAGIFQLGNPHKKSSPLQAIVDILYLPNLEIRKQIVSLLFEALCLRVPPPTTDTDEALAAVADPSTFKDSWKLAEGFVAAEGLDILPHLAKSRPNLLESHKCLLLLCLLHVKLPDALVKVIVSSPDEVLSLQTTILLGEMLHLTYLLLPREVNVTMHCLPALLAEVSTSDPERSNRASAAVTVLHRLHALKKRGPVACSLFFDQILSSSSSERRVALTPSTSADADRMSSAIRDTRVLTGKDPSQWQWELVVAVLKPPASQQLLRTLDNSMHKQFVRKIVDYYKPTNNLFSKVNLTHHSAKFLAKIGCFLIDFLVQKDKKETSEINRVLDELLVDIHLQLKAVISAESAHDCLFSPTRMATTACQYYFLFVGRLSTSIIGRCALDKQEILQSFVELLPMRSDMYLKLVISCLDYSNVDWGSRNLLAKALRDDAETRRLYATKFLGVLIRNRTHNVAQWGIEFLIGQLFDSSPVVALTALEILDEACDDKMNLEALICAVTTTSASLDHLGDRGTLILVRFLTSVQGFKYLTQNKFVETELQRWATGFNEKYVTMVEEALNDGLTRHQHEVDRAYGRRSHEGHTLRNVFVPPHLYGQLAQTDEGMAVLLKEEAFWKMVKAMENVDEWDWLKTKAAVWALCHVGSSPQGATLLHREGVIAQLVGVAESSPVYSLRHTAFFALGLVATNRPGANALATCGWAALRNSREDGWPVMEEWIVEQVDPSSVTTSPGTPPPPETPRRGHSAPSTRRLEDDSSTTSSQLTHAAIEIGGLSPSGDSSFSNRVGSLLRSFGKGRRRSFTAKIRQSLRPRSRTVSAGSSGASFMFEDPAAPIATPENSNPSLPDTSERLSPIPSSPMLKKRDDMRVPRHKCISESEATEKRDESSFITAKMAKKAQMKEALEQGASITSVCSSIGSASWADTPGFATLRSIYRERRPPLSESEADHHDPLGRSNSWKTRSLDYRWTRGQQRTPTVRSVPVTAAPLMLTLHEEDAGGPEPQYWGITVPVGLESFFPKEEEVEEETEADPPPDVDLPDPPDGLELHSPSLCLACYRMVSPRSRRSSLELVRGGSLESVASSVGSEEASSHVLQRKEVLKLVGSMNSTIGVKAAEQGLLRLKQKFPKIFHDLCLYSEVCLLLTRYHYRLGARRCIQELFMDLPYNELYDEPSRLLGLDPAQTNTTVGQLTQLAEIDSDDVFFHDF